MKVVEEHVKRYGPYHDNKCPRCDKRFFTRQEIVEHMKTMKHEGSKCGFCNEVFDNENQLKGHKPHCNEKPQGSICPDCGKSFVKMGDHIRTVSNCFILTNSDSCFSNDFILKYFK